VSEPFDPTSPDHERADELLAGYVLRSLSGEDASEADRLLTEHVPTCQTCRETLADFQAVTAELALDATPIAPPDTLLPRLRRQLEPATPRRRPVQLFAVAASAVAVIGLGGLALTQGMRASHSRGRMADIQAALDAALLQPGANRVQVGPTTEISAPGSTQVYLYGSGVPEPPDGEIYRVWLVGADGGSTYVGDLPIEDGVAFARLTFDPSQVSQILITIEPADGLGSQPGSVAWSSAA
jgi:anti-sigma-K factor RskA